MLKNLKRKAGCGTLYTVTEVKCDSEQCASYLLAMYVC
jgi:hypothetical protein